jgi:hypothetical protein
MADETRPDLTPDREGATPNRDRRHEPPIIEGEVARAEDAAGDDRAPGPEPDPAPSGDGAESAAPQSGARPLLPPAAAPAAEALRSSGRPVLSAAIGALVGAIVAAAGVSTPMGNAWRRWSGPR